MSSHGNGVRKISSGDSGCRNPLPIRSDEGSYRGTVINSFGVGGTIVRFCGISIYVDGFKGKQQKKEGADTEYSQQRSPDNCGQL